MNKRMTVLADEDQTVDLLFLQADDFTVQSYILPRRIRRMEIKDDDIGSVTDNSAFFTSSLLVCDDLEWFPSVLSLVSGCVTFVIISLDPDLLLHPVQAVVFPWGRGGMYTVHL